MGAGANIILFGGVIACAGSGYLLGVGCVGHMQAAGVLFRALCRKVQPENIQEILTAQAQTPYTKIRLSICAGLMGFLCIQIITQNLLASCLIAPVAAVLSTAFCRYLVRQQAEKIIEEARHELPQLIDIVSLAMSAGTSFDAGLKLYCARCDTRLSTAFSDALTSWELGIETREQALRRLCEAYPFEGMRRFVETVLESIAFGAPLSSALQNQSGLMRAEYQSYVREKIEQAPVKMLVPIGVLILPGMLLTILGPLFASALLATH